MSDQDAGSIVTDEPGNDAGDFDATEAFLKSFDEKKDEPEAPSGNSEEPTSPGATEAKPPADDEQEIEWKSGEETRKAKLSDLTRLYGQEASITQKSQVVAELRAKAESDSLRATTLMTDLTTRSEAAWEPYGKLDFLTLSTQMDPTEFAQLRAEAKAALDNRDYHRTSLDGLMAANAQRNADTFRERAAATINELSDPVKGISGWDQAMYGDVMNYAVSQGMPPSAAQSIVEASSLRMIHKAMLFDKAAKSGTATVAKVVEKAKVELKAGTSRASAADAGDFKSALKSMRSRGGSHDSTVDAFMAFSK